LKLLDVSKNKILERLKIISCLISDKNMQHIYSIFESFSRNATRNESFDFYSSLEINYLAAKTMKLLGVSGRWRECLKILHILESPDSFSYTSCIRYYEDECGVEE
jgi:hypothetical protein